MSRRWELGSVLLNPTSPRTITGTLHTDQFRPPYCRVHLIGDGGGPYLIENVTASGQAGNVTAAGVAVYNFSGGTFQNIHSEQSSIVFAMLSVGVTGVTSGTGAEDQNRSPTFKALASSNITWRTTYTGPTSTAYDLDIRLFYLG
jgi:hypothetical protein